MIIIKRLLFIVFFINVMVLPMTHLHARDLYTNTETAFFFHHSKTKQHTKHHKHNGADCCSHTHCGLDYFLPNIETVFVLIGSRSFYDYFDISYISYLNFFIERPPKA